ncbi:MAG: hypothetical protein IT176_15270 [Acidobacteria bacterium]|nr:hypothetical protein [Acidobacteriota bacterium]
MSLTTILFFFLSHLGIGIIFTLVFVARAAGVKFFRFNAGLAAMLLVVALAFRYGVPDAPGAGSGGAARGGLLALEAAMAAAVVYWATVGRMLASIRPLLAGTAAGAGLLALVLQALAIAAGHSWAVQVMTAASFVSSAALLGGACTAMVLGHWYLVIPSMDVRHLQSMVMWHMVSMAVRLVVVAAAVALAFAAWQPGAGPSFRRYVLSIDGIFFWQRVLFGLAGPAVLSYLTWETAKIRSTQSATGILYVDLFTVIVGEILAKYILLATHVPV